MLSTWLSWLTKCWKTWEKVQWTRSKRRSSELSCARFGREFLSWVGGLAVELGGLNMRRMRSWCAASVIYFEKQFCKDCWIDIKIQSQMSFGTPPFSWPRRVPPTVGMARLCLPSGRTPAVTTICSTLVAGACSERKKMFLGGSFLKLADDNKYIKNPEAQNREVRGFWENRVWKFYIIGI